MARNTHIVLRTTQARFKLAIQKTTVETTDSGSLSPKVPSFVLVLTRVHR